MLEKPDPDTLMAGPLGSWLQQQVAVREAAKKQSWDRLWKAAIFGGPVLLLLVIAIPIDMQMKLFGAFFICSAAFGWSQMPKVKAVRQVKVGINEAIAEALGLTYALEVEDRTIFERSKRFKLLPGHDRSGLEDLWSGETMGHVFSLHEATLEERRGSGKNRRWVTVFRGAIMSFGCSRDIYGTTLVQRKGKHRKFFGGQKETIKLGNQHLNLCDMVHPGFEDVFDIYTTDQVEARYLVHPLYVERLLELENAFGGQDIRALFHAGEVLVVLKAGNMFESGSINAADDRRRLSTTIAQFGKLADLAASLNEWDSEAATLHAKKPDPARDGAEFVATAAAVARMTEAAPRVLGFGRKAP